MVKLDCDLRIRLSKTLVEAIGWDKGDEIRIKLDSKGNIILSNTKEGVNNEHKTIFG